jgi:hypothetical protein
MTPIRESFLLPGLFLTVTLLGGLRVSSSIRLIPPSLSAIVLAVLLIGALVRSRVVLPAALLDSTRKPLENLCGAVVLVTLLAATSQAISLVVPERGLLHFAFVVFLLVQFASLAAAGIDRRGMLRSLFVLLGSAFVLRFIVLESLYASDGGTLKRVLTALMTGVTLGGIEYAPHAAITGYVALATLTLYFIGLVLLPSGQLSSTSTLVPTAREGLVVPLLLCAVVATTSACGADAALPARENPATVGEAKASDGPGRAFGSRDSHLAALLRDETLASARVWRPPAVPPSAANLGANPPTSFQFGENDDVDCRFSLEPVGGMTLKFNCELPDGSLVKVKYGETNQELFAEVAATRLVSALGFGADRMHVVRSVRCAGCPAFPFAALRCLAKTGMRRVCLPRGIAYAQVVSFETAVVEQRLEGRKVEAVEDQGWAWYELGKIDPARGGSSRAEVDALRLVAVFLAHWDNKAENQRLVCLPSADAPGGRCTDAFAIMQDLGASFGPTKLDLHNWRNNPVWADPRTCRVSMEHLPFGGGTFPEQQISEEGRLFLLRLIGQLSSTQIEALFSSSRVTTFDGITAEGRNAAAWTSVFFEKVRQIREAGPCPPGDVIAAQGAKAAG